MAKKGFIKIPKRMFDTKWWNQKRVFSECEAIIDLYQSANAENITSTTLRTLADRWIWNQVRVMRLLNRLQKEEYLSVTNSSNGTTINLIDFGMCENTGCNKSVTPSVTLDDEKCNTETLINKGIDDGRCNTDSVTGVTPSVTKVLHDQKKEKNQKKEIYNKTKKENSGLTTTIKEAELLAEVMQFFNKTVDGCLIPKVKSITGERRSMLLARIREYSLEEVYEAFTKAASSNFLNGGGNKGFRADFTWIVRPNNFPKVLEGNYDNRNNNGTINNRSDAAKQRMADAANLIARLAAEDDARQKVW